MSVLAARAPAALAMRHCLRVAALPGALGAVAAWLLGACFAAGAAAGSPAGAAAPWLVAPMLVVAATCAGAAVRFWPLFATHQPGAPWLQRLQRGPLRGCGAVLVGALAAQLLLTLPAAMVLPRLLGAPATARAHVDLEPPPEPLLQTPGQRLVFTLPQGTIADELRLRPLAAPPHDRWVQSRLQVVADGELLPTGDVAFGETGQLVRVPFAARPIARLELVFVEGTVPLFFPRGSASLVAIAAHGTHWNGALAAVAGLVPTFAALALAVLGGTAAALPTVATVLGGVLFVLTLGGIGPFDEGWLHVLRGQWLPATAVFPACLPSLAVGCMAMIVAMLLRRRFRP